jgi:flagellar biosynthesis protein FlhA
MQGLTIKGFVSKLTGAPAAVAVPFGILILFILMVLPIPTTLLDILLVFNIAMSVAILMVALNSRKPLDFSSFPSVLLFATLMRLALNVASTRIVLVNGHDGGAAAGAVIDSFGAFLVGGNFAVGLFVFAILLIINMIVITKGAGRVSEVSARFVLDALPGKQMAIDADIAAGVIDPKEARNRRSEVTVEADFYGSMDGASKFVKGDAIAALLILSVNVIAGFALGMLSHGLSAGESAEKYITLAVGDALVAQVPALLLSIAAAAIVTRVSDTRDLVGQISGQFSDPRGWLPVAMILGAFGLVPAMPQTIFIPGAAIALGLWYYLRKVEAQPEVIAEVVEEEPPDRIAVSDVSDQTLVTIELGFGLVGLVDKDKGAPLLARITGIRKQLSRDFGFVLPQFRIRDAIELGANDYRIVMGGVVLGQDEARPGRILAIDSGDVIAPHALKGESVSDPSFGCPAIWITEAERDHAIADGFLTVDPSTVIATHANRLLMGRGSDMLGPEQVRELLDNVKEANPGLVEAVHPEPLSLAAVTRIFRALLDDGIGIGHPLPILSALAIALQRTQDFGELVDAVRADLGTWIVGQICRPGELLNVATLEASLESAILGGMVDPSTGQPMIDPDCGKMIAETMNEAVAKTGGPVALIVQPPARRAIASLLKTRVPQALVLSIQELPASQGVEVVAVISRPRETQVQAALPPSEAPSTQPPQQGALAA